ncbi:Uncharacterised protein [Mycobacterium tuberculosis]|nr:Uncharacterised protein [Mycobacterium tuberculosis]
MDPEELLDVLVAVQRFTQSTPGQRGELFKPHDREVIAVVLGLAGGQLVIQLATGQQDPADLVAVSDAILIGGFLQH